MCIKLNELPLGHTGLVLKLLTEDMMTRQLQSLGFIPGAALQPLFAAPGGDPRAYWICGSCIALRNQDAAQILVRQQKEL